MKKVSLFFSPSNSLKIKAVLGGFAAVDARVILKAFDSDTNGLVEGDELTNWKNFVKGQLAENGWNPSEDSLNGMKAAWANAQVDGDDNSASMLELARFVVGAWNVLLQ